MKITIVEDERILANKVKSILKNRGFWVNIYHDIKSFKENILYPSDLYLIDIKLPDWNGFELINYIRNIKKINSPIIITSWLWNDENIVYWLDLWADDYLQKPYSLEELLARIRSIIRRKYKIEDNYVINHKNISYDFSKKILKINWKEIELRSKELNLVELVLLNKWKFLSKTEIINSVWWEKDPLNITDNNINVTISNIRKKIWKDFNLKTKINKWYILED